ncbi:MAG TPA: murein biosynthesis integral membrane protein MurJ [Nevskiaceae bacterium]|nr:murein biosynthesis integral membrane protein MurJ [Nevskiaceae bacterium]
MMKNFFRNGSNFLTRRQKNILSAAAVIMIMVAASRFLGLVRNRVLAHFFSVETISVYLAAFRLPEVVFEVLVFGALSSAFIPTFTRYLAKKQKEQAWYVASVSLNFAFLLFFLLSILIFLFARPLYQVLAPGFNPHQLNQVARLTRILLVAQAFFVLSYFLTGVLESLQRFLIPAIAPLFYNLGIILGAIFFASRWGVYAPALGAVIGAFFHFLIQLPLAYHLGFRPRLSLDFVHPGVREIGRLALPRIIELSFLQIGKNAELFLASLIAAGAYTHYTFANSLQLLPVGLFGISIAKASLPTLSSQSARGDFKQFRETFIASFNEIVFLIIPSSIFLAVLRIPLVRLVFGAQRFTWESTVQTSYTFSAFCLGILAQALIYLLNRAFYALQDTKTPVKISITAIFIHIFLAVILTLGFKLPIWSLALAYSLAVIIQFGLLCLFLCRRLKRLRIKKITVPFLKILLSASCSGGLMYFLLKILDRSVWDKRLFFLARLGITLPTTFKVFVLDTRYTPNLIVLTVLVSLVGLLSYLFLTRLLRVKEVAVFARILLKFKQLKIFRTKIPKKKEPITLPSE